MVPLSLGETLELAFGDRPAQAAPIEPHVLDTSDPEPIVLPSDAGADDEIRRVIQAMYSDVPLDPVARITSPTDSEDRTSLTPFKLTQELFEQDPVIDRMTSTRAERAQGRKTFKQSTPGSSAAFQAAQAATGMSTGDFARKMLAREGSEYEWGGTTKKTGYDCSGIINRIMTNAGYTNYPRHSSAIYEHSKKISVEKAIKTRGAILYTEGHIAVSLGNGKTIEARGEDYGVVVADAHGRFTHGGLLPELKLGKATKTYKPKVKGKRIYNNAPKDPMNRVTGVSPLISASTVFGQIVSEVENPPQTASEWDEETEAKGLGFVPKKYRDIFREAADKYGIAPRLLATIAKHESGFDPNAVSDAGAQGVMQIMPLHGLGKPFNAKQSIFKGAEIFASYINAAKDHELSARYDPIRLALAMYNAGPENTNDVLISRMKVYSDPILADFYRRAA